MENRRLIRKEVMLGNGDKIRDLLLTSSQINLIKFVGLVETITSSELARAKVISTQNASSKLNRLYRAGYLERLSVNAESGGTEFVYRAQEYGS